MKDELKYLFGREVDIVDREAVDKSENYIRKENILKSAESIYVA